MQKRKQFVVLVAVFVALMLSVQVAITSFYEHANEGLEHSVFKGDFLHSFWNHVGETAVLPPSKGPLVVFQHVPRTAGDAMRTHLFHDVQVDGSFIWPHQFNNKGGLTFLSDEDVEVANDPRTKMIKGFYSKRDLDAITREKRVFVFLREPMERIGSIVSMVGPYNKVCTGNEQGQLDCETTYLTPAQISVNVDPGWPCSFTQNAVTWQLGDQQHCLARNKTLSNEELLANAKATIDAADFVGFYETLDEDFWALKERIFPDVALPSYVPFAFWFGTMISVPRLRVAKFAASWGAEETAKVLEANHLDAELYQWAQAKYRPGLIMYPNYSSFMQEHMMGTVMVSIALTAMCFCAGWCAVMCCMRCMRCFVQCGDRDLWQRLGCVCCCREVWGQRGKGLCRRRAGVPG